METIVARRAVATGDDVTVDEEVAGVSIGGGGSREEGGGAAAPTSVVGAEGCCGLEKNLERISGPRCRVTIARTRCATMSGSAETASFISLIASGKRRLRKMEILCQNNRAKKDGRGRVTSKCRQLNCFTVKRKQKNSGVM